jgi:hypothetical protein
MKCLPTRNLTFSVSNIRGESAREKELSFFAEIETITTIIKLNQRSTTDPSEIHLFPDGTNPP